MPAAPPAAPAAPSTQSANPLAANFGGTGQMAKALEGLGTAEAKPGPSSRQRQFNKEEPKTDTTKAPEPPKAKEPLKEPTKEPDETHEEPTKEVEASKDGKEIKADEAPTGEDKVGKTSPWKLVNTYKSENAQLKTKLATLEKQVSDKGGEDLAPKLETATKRLKELEQEIEFVNYSKSETFNTKYQKPYEDAFSKAASDLRGLTVRYEDAGDLKERPIDVDDIAFLANLPPEKARVQIKAWFPEDYAEVRNHVTEVRRLADTRKQALDDARKNGDERNGQYQQQMKAIQEHASKAFEKYTAENATKFEFLKTVDGDDEYNGALTKAQEMVNQGLAKNAYDPRLTTEQRDDVIKQQASIRDRAIAYSTLKLANKRLNAKIAELEKSLKDYQGTEPGAGDRKGKDNGAPIPPGGNMGAALDRLGKYV